MFTCLCHANFHLGLSLTKLIMIHSEMQVKIAAACVVFLFQADAMKVVSQYTAT